MKSAGSGVKVRTGDGGRDQYQHSRRTLKVRAGVKSGGMSYQHNRRVLSAR